ncbi:exopolyphosphatase [Orenia metallireducens]|uniref:Exopolyphosphatase n=1 Tax=Orenia metallireducens TaxID=1413210 RepID=A0A1C0A6I7_9FIRM|nr:Ppx/GppA phosphatase family protein [Orenia metallireducens]OCL25729.1 exopolyphosphatase [Orenia metallireducens]
MRVGAIDIGTNSVRLLIAEQANNGLNKLVSELRTPRLGEGIHQNGYLKKEAILRTIKVLREYKEIINNYNAEVVAIATSAVRDAKNQDIFLKRVKEETGIDIKVIKGTEEARLSYLGVVSAIEDLENQVLVIDIGGGSTEFIFGKYKDIMEFNSINLGAVRLTESYGEHLKEMKREAKDMLVDLLKDKNVEQLIGVGGTVTTLVSIREALEVYDYSIVHGSDLSKEEIIQILDDLSSLSLEERKEVIGLDAKRADIILGGIVILLEIMEQSKQDIVKVSDDSILEGVVIDTLN